MAMTMNGEVQLAAPRNVVWEKLNDAEVLKQCIPGCEELNKTSDTEFQAIATIKIGPVKASSKAASILAISIRPTATRFRATERAASPDSPRAPRPYLPTRMAARCLAMMSKRRLAASSLSLVSA